eukprot:TRINITY_DN21034_c0_g1_i1.p1 TRINITY_DN21034_c0_g1~~TRINITY_DN21034_c0_g1_i1.p1  ORF type:complete len:339 (+),score=31.25 TRINITY_DN21034_c0_g1_i1:53-1069(+)
MKKEPVAFQGNGRNSGAIAKYFKERLIGGKFKVGKKLGAGSFGEIYQAQHENTGDSVAVKVESVSAKYPQLVNEAMVYKALNANGSRSGIPRLHWYGAEGDYNIMVVDLLGPSLEELFNFCKRKLSVKTVLLLADQLLSRIELLHRHNYIHRDIKPDNFLMGVGSKSHVVYMIDLGLAKRYFNHNHHIPYRDGKSLAGTARYVSINTHQGYEQSRRDDIESIGYVLLYFLKGALPWQNVKAMSKKEKYDLISKKKSSFPIEKLCANIPQEFSYYLRYARSLKFEDQPAYGKLRTMFRDLYSSYWDTADYQYDWVMQKTRVRQNNPNAVSAAAEEKVKV